MVDELEVYVAVGERDKPAGRAWFHRRGPRVSVDFTFDPGYLGDPTAVQFDPAIPLVSGAQHFDGLPGSFQDCSPDRWGRNLISKRSRLQARLEGRTPPSVSDLDFLTGVSDRTRQGALRFASAGNFVGDNVDVPKLISLPELLGAADSIDSTDGLAAVKALLDAGSGSLGGARPKASVIDNDGRLAIAKFPKPDDPYDVIGWEKTALDLAEAAGISVPARRIERVDGRSVLVIDRFDRDDTGARRLYVSAMTLVGASDGDQRDYSDIADSLSDNGANVAADLANLYRRAVFNVAVHNTDDHLRNHGFLSAGPSGWGLSPIFDVNPNVDEGAQRQTAISGAYGIDDEDTGLAMLAGQCGLSADAADQIASDVAAAVAGWRTAAAANRISEADISIFAPAFTSGLDVIDHRHRKT